MIFREKHTDLRRGVCESVKSDNENQIVAEPHGGAAWKSRILIKKYLGMHFVAVAGLEPATSPRMGRFNHLSFTAGKYNTDLLAPPSRIAALFHRCL